EMISVAPVGCRETNGAVHLDRPGCPAGGDHARRRLEFRDQGGRAFRIGAQVDRLLTGPQRIASDRKAAQGYFDLLPLQTPEQIRSRLQLDPHADRFRGYFREILWSGGDSVICRLVLLKLLLAEIRVVARVDLGHGLADRDLSLELETVAGRPSHQLHGYRLFAADGLRGARPGLSAHGQVGDKAILAVRTSGEGIADVE